MAWTTLHPHHTHLLSLSSPSWVSDPLFLSAPMHSTRALSFLMFDHCQDLSCLLYSYFPIFSVTSQVTYLLPLIWTISTDFWELSWLPSLPVSIHSTYQCLTNTALLVPHSPRQSLNLWAWHLRPYIFWQNPPSQQKLCSQTSLLLLLFLSLLGVLYPPFLPHPPTSSVLRILICQYSRSCYCSMNPAPCSCLGQIPFKTETQWSFSFAFFLDHVTTTLQNCNGRNCFVSPTKTETPWGQELCIKQFFDLYST